MNQTIDTLHKMKNLAYELDRTIGWIETYTNARNEIISTGDLMESLPRIEVKIATLEAEATQLKAEYNSLLSTLTTL